MNPRNNTIVDTKNVADVLKQYELGTQTRNIELLRQIAHKDCSMAGYLGSDLLIGSLEPFFDFLANNEVSENYRSAICINCVEGNTARAKVIEENLFGMSFVNDFHLIKVDADWLIVAKLFYHF